FPTRRSSDLVPVRKIGELVLFLAADLPFLGHQFAGLAHGKAGARLGNTREGRLQVLRAQLQPGLELVTEAPAAVGFEHDFAEVVAVDDGHVGGGGDAAGDAGVDLPEGDLVGDVDDGLQAGAAGAAQVERRGVRVEA